MRCRLCGRGIDEASWLTRVNETGQPGVWECRPTCGIQVPQEDALLAAIEDDTSSDPPHEEG